MSEDEGEHKGNAYKGVTNRNVLIIILEDLRFSALSRAAAAPLFSIRCAG
jgi:hypothetical protein